MPDEHGPTRQEIAAQLRLSDRKAAPVVWGMRLASYGAMAVAILAYQAGDPRTATLMAGLFLVGIVMTQVLRMKALRRFLKAQEAAKAAADAQGQV